MSNYEWISIMLMLGGGFYAVVKSLADIKAALKEKVSYKDCSDKRDHCPCVRDRDARIAEITSKLNRKDLEE